MLIGKKYAVYSIHNLSDGVRNPILIESGANSTEVKVVASEKMQMSLDDFNKNFIIEEYGDSTTGFANTGTRGLLWG